MARVINAEKRNVTSKSSTEWYNLNKILKLGEIAHSIDNGMIKIGDGITPWRSLKYITDWSNVQSPPSLPSGFYVQATEPVGVPNGSVWIQV